MPRDWPAAVLGALQRAAGRSSNRVTRRALIAEELPRIIAETDSQGSTPHQTLSRVLQDLRDQGRIRFLGRGSYALEEGPRTQVTTVAASSSANEPAAGSFKPIPILFTSTSTSGARGRSSGSFGRHTSRRSMRRGDRVFIWRAKGGGKAPAGVIASGWLAEAPRMQADDSLGATLWRGNQPKIALRVVINVDQVARGPREEVQRSWLLEDPVLKDLRILRFASETNYQLTPTQAARLEVLWAHTGRDWSRDESVAGLWAYARTYGGAVSRMPGSPVAIVAERIGRATGEL